jgi:hypothetical protein
MTPAPVTLERRRELMLEYLWAHPEHDLRKVARHIRIVEGRPREGDLEMERATKENRA